ncbi:MAG: hypothetical protein HY261_03405, partial [Chloroflexi bacterium]|nr:hypothetical protein [Chloroflexota bacterium]
MAKDPRMLIAVDLGTSSVRVAAARYTTPKDYEIFALGQAPSLGIGRGLLENIDQASYAIRQACEDARLDEATRGAEVVVGINGKHLSSQNVSGQTVIGRGDGTVTER